MASSTENNTESDAWRTWHWVSNAGFSATPFYKEAWAILKQDWLIFVWKLIADFVQRASLVAVGLLIFGLFIFDLQLYLNDGGTPFGWVDHLLIQLRTPAFFAGLAGTLFFVSLLATAIQAFVMGGIWGLIDTGLRGSPIRRWSTFWDQALRRYPDILSLHLLRFALGLVNGLLAFSLAVALHRAWSTGGFTEAPGWLVAFVIAGSITFLIAWSGLSRLLFEVIGAPLVVDDVDLGEAILRGADFVLDNFWSLYRLLIFAFGLLLIPLGLYWAAIMFNNLSYLLPSLSLVGTVVQMSGQLLLTLSMTILGVFFYGALFAFYWRDDQTQDRRSKPDAPNGHADPGEESAAAHTIFGEHTTVSDFIPADSPYRFPIDDVLPPSNPD